MNNNNILKKIASFMLIVVLSITLAACGNKNKAPMGDIDDSTYLVVGDIKITKRQLYDELRKNTSTALQNEINEIVFKEQIDVVKDVVSKTTHADYKEYIKFIEDKAINSILQLTDVKTIDKMSKNTLELSVTSYIDSLNLVTAGDIEITIADLVLLIKTKVAATLAVSKDGKEEVEDYIPYGFPEIILEKQHLELARKIYAQQFLVTDAANKKGDIYDKDSSAYIDEDAIFNYYKENLHKKEDVKVFLISFTNTNEVSTLLRGEGLKSTAQGWYKIHMPFDFTLNDINNTPGLAFIKGILESINVYDLIDDSNLDAKISLTSKQEQAYYEAYSVSTERTAYNDIRLETSAILQKFVDFDNLVNNSGVTVADALEVQTYEELGEIDSSLRNYIYNTLIPDETDHESKGKQYTTSVQSFGGKSYLIFRDKNEDAVEYKNLLNEDEDAFLTKDDDGYNDEIKLAIEEAQKKAREELTKEKLTTTYITEKVTEMFEDAKQVKIEIYDPIIRVFYNHENDTKIKSKFLNNETIAKINDSEIKVNDLYKLMEELYGVSYSFDMAMNKVLIRDYSHVLEGKDNKQDRKDLETQMKNRLSEFANGAYAEQGFPASIGQKNFLMLAFGASSREELLENDYYLPKYKEAFQKDYEAHFGTTGGTIYEKFSLLTEKFYDNDWSLNVSHLLIAMDFDNDAEIDDPNKVREKLTQAEWDELIDLVIEFQSTIKHWLTTKGKSELSESLTSLVAEFESSFKFEPTTGDNLEVHKTWSKFKSAGLSLKYENLSDVTNQTNFPGDSGSYDEVFFRRVAQIVELNENNGLKLPFLDTVDNEDTIDLSLLKKPITDPDYDNKIMSSFGWHLINVNPIYEKDKSPFGKQTSAKFTAADDANGTYKDVEVTITNDKGEKEKVKFDIYNGNETLTANQIAVYLLEQEDDNDYGTLLPSEVTKAITTYFSPVLTKYQSATMQRYLLLKTLTGYVFTDTLVKARAEEFVKINNSQFFEYSLNTNPEYTNVYKDWFEILEGTYVNPKVATVTSEAELIAAISNNLVTTITLANDITLTTTLVIDRKGLIIDGNGKVLTGNSIAPVIEVRDTKDIIIKNIKISGGSIGLLVNSSNVTLQGNIDVSSNGTTGIKLIKDAAFEKNPKLDISSATLVNTTEATTTNPTIIVENIQNAIIGGSLTQDEVGTDYYYYLVV